MKKNTHQLAPLVVSVLAGIIYFLLSLRFNGPAYLTDEVSYLVKAAALVGNSVDMASSWFIGYSIFIAPAFLFFNNAQDVWVFVLFVNAILFSSSFILLASVLKKLFTKASTLNLMFAMSLSMLYPSLVVMSGYAFATPAITFIFMLTLFFLANLKTPSDKKLLYFGLLSGLIYWAHPTGLVVSIAAVFIIALTALANREIKMPIVSVILIGIMVIAYKYFIHPSINSIMTPSGQLQWNHYSNSINLGKFLTINPWLRWFGAFSGQIAYMLVATFGIVGYAFFELKSSLMSYVKNTRSTKDLSIIYKNKKSMVMIFMLLVIIGVAVVGSFGQGFSTKPIRVDHWIYGRYLDAFLLPLISIGILSKWKRSTSLIMAYAVLVIGVLFGLVLNVKNTILFDNNIVNITSFWPLLLSKETVYLVWFFVGSLSIIVMGLIVSFFEKKSLLLIIPAYVLTINLQYSWHSGLLNGYSKTPAFAGIIKGAYERGACIGFEYDTSKRITGVPENEALRLLAYNLYNYDMERMSVEDWNNSCDGVYLTPLIHNGLHDAQYIARDETTGLYMISKQKDVQRLNDKMSEINSIFSDSNNENCVKSGCFSNDASELSKYTNVGELRDGAIHTTGRAGILFYGPYYKLKSGKYTLTLDGEIKNVGDARIKVTSLSGSKIHLDQRLSSEKQYIINLPNDEIKFEINVYVGESTEASFRGYKVQ